MASLNQNDEEGKEYYAYTVSHHPSSPHHEEDRYRLICTTKSLPKQYTGFDQGHMYFPKIVSVGKLTQAHIELFQTCVDKSSSDSELREDAACDMDSWDFSFTYYQEGSRRMFQEGSRSGFYGADQDHMLLAFPLWEIWFIPAAENSINEDILCVKTWSKEAQRLLLEVVYPYQLLANRPSDMYHMYRRISFTFGSMRFVRKFIPNRQLLDNLTLRDCIIRDRELAEKGNVDEFRAETIIQDGIEELRKFATKRDEILQQYFPENEFETNYWEIQP